MNYEERERQLCNNCEAKENCSYISRNLERKCSFQETTMYGWELGWQDAIDKVCEFMQSCEGYVVSGNKCNYENFIKYMEEQQ